MATDRWPGSQREKEATHQLKPGHQPSSLSFLGVAAQGFWRSRPRRSRNGSSRRRPHCGGPTMSRQQLPPLIRKIEVLDRKTAEIVVRYQLTVDAGLNPQTGRRQQVRRRYVTEKQARDALAEVTQQAATHAFVPRKAVTVEALCADWLASLHNARATTSTPTPTHSRRCGAARRSARAEADPSGSGPTADRPARRWHDDGQGTGPAAWSPRSLNKAVDSWRMMLDYGVERRELAHNVATSMRKVPRCAGRWPPTRPRRSVGCCAADKDRSGHLWYLALSGLRRGEISGLRWSDVDLDAAPSPPRGTGCRPAPAMSSRVSPRRGHRVAHCHSTTVW